MAVKPMRVDRERHEVYIFLNDGTRIKGKLHAAPGSRLLDSLNYQLHDRPFMAMTDATILFANGDKYTIPFLSINKVGISLCFPVTKKDEM